MTIWDAVINFTISVAGSATVVLWLNRETAIAIKSTAVSAKDTAARTLRIFALGVVLPVIASLLALGLDVWFIYRFLSAKDVPSRIDVFVLVVAVSCFFSNILLMVILRSGDSARSVMAVVVDMVRDLRGEIMRERDQPTRARRRKL